MHGSPACSAEHTGCFPGSRLSLAAFPAPQDTARSKPLSPGWLLKTQSNPPVKGAAVAKFPVFTFPVSIRRVQAVGLERSLSR